MRKAGHSDYKKCVKSMMDLVLSIELMKEFNWKGQRSSKEVMKKSFLSWFWKVMSTVSNRTSTNSN